MQFNIPAEHKNASGVYIIRSSESEKVYIGSTHDFRERYNEHRRLLIEGKHRTWKLRAHAKAHPNAVFSFNLLELAPRHELFAVEQQHLDAYNASPASTFNTSPIVWAGVLKLAKIEKLICLACGKEFDAKAHARRKYCSRACAPLPTCPPEIGRANAARMHEANRKKEGPGHRAGIPSPRKGTKISEETREKMRAAKRGMKVSDATREGHKRSLAGGMSPEQRKKIAEANIGKKRGPHSAETKAKMSARAKERLANGVSPEVKAKISATLKKKALPPTLFD